MIDDYEPDRAPVLANSGALDVRPAGSGGRWPAGVRRADGGGGSEGEIRHGDWLCVEAPEDDGDGWSSPGWYARNLKTHKTRLIQHSRFSFHMTEARFCWLVENNFPRSPGRGPWTDTEIDLAMEDGA